MAGRETLRRRRISTTVGSGRWPAFGRHPEGAAETAGLSTAVDRTALAEPSLGRRRIRWPRGLVRGVGDRGNACRTGGYWRVDRPLRLRLADTPAARAAWRRSSAPRWTTSRRQSLPPEVCQAYAVLDREAGMPSEGPAGAPDGDREPFDPQRRTGPPRRHGLFRRNQRGRPAFALTAALVLEDERPRPAVRRVGRIRVTVQFAAGDQWPRGAVSSDGAQFSNRGRSTTWKAASSSAKAAAPRGAHSDIAKPEVAHAVWEAVLAMTRRENSS